MRLCTHHLAQVSSCAVSDAMQRAVSSLCTRSSRPDAECAGTWTLGHAQGMIMHFVS